MSELEELLASIPKADGPLDVKEMETNDAKLFARKDKLKHLGPYLVGNFTKVPGDACFYPYMTSVDWARVIKTTDLRPCAEGSLIVEIEIVPKDKPL